MTLSIMTLTIMILSVLLYECNPTHPNAKEIATVTDHVTGYACKGNAT